jgi:hypothetical protein
MDIDQKLQAQTVNLIHPTVQIFYWLFDAVREVTIRRGKYVLKTVVPINCLVWKHGVDRLIARRVQAECGLINIIYQNTFDRFAVQYTSSDGLSSWGTWEFDLLMTRNGSEQTALKQKFPNVFL